MPIDRLFVFVLAAVLSGCGVYDALTHNPEGNGGGDAGIGDDADNGPGPTPATTVTPCA